MIPAAATLNEIVQHLTVSAVALAACVVVLRRVLGVFERRPTTPTEGPGLANATPACGHCAAGSAAAKKLAQR